MEPATLKCQFCIYKDKLDESKAFTTTKKEEMIAHYSDKHGIDFDQNREQLEKVVNEPLKYGQINWFEKDTPLSKQLMFVQGNYPPIQLRVIIEDEKRFEDTYMPSFPIVLYKEEKDPEDARVSIVKIPTTINGKFYNVVFSLFEVDVEDFTLFSLPLGGHTACMECPMAFNKGFIHLSEMVENEEFIETVLKIERDVFYFKCHFDICPGLWKIFGEKLIRYKPSETEGMFYAEKSTKKDDQESGQESNQETSD